MRPDRYTPLDLVELATYRILRRLPIELVSGFGANLAKLECIRAHRFGASWTRVVLANISRLTGETDQKVLHRRLLRSAENTGRLRAEYAILDRLTASDRIVYEGFENILKSVKPIIFFSAHLSNWEVIAPAMASRGVAMSPLVKLPHERGRRQIVDEVRNAFARLQPEQEVIAASGNSMRQCVKTLSDGKNLLVYVDEERDGLVWCPHLGRKLPNQGNRVFVARLAVRFQAAVVPVRISRTGGVNFVCRYMPALPMPSTGDRSADTKILADAITEHVEEWVRAELDDWFWLPQLDLDKKFPSSKQ